MDIATIAGILAGVTLIVLSIMSNASLSTFVDVPSALVVIGGAIAATFINFPLKNVFSVMGIIKKTVLGKNPDPKDTIQSVVGYAEKARKEGMLALENESESEPDEFLRKGLRLAVDGTDPALLQTIMRNDMFALEGRHELGQNIMNALGTYAPAFGMIGTLIGLVTMLTGMDDPSSIGAGMAVALLTTFYGALLANVFFLPLAGKLKTRSAEEMLLKELAIEGIIAIQSGDSPRIVEEKLKSFLAPKDRISASKEE